MLSGAVKAVAPVAAVLALAGLAGCGDDHPSAKRPAAGSGADPCAEASAHQQLATAFKPRDAASGKARVDALIGEGTLPDAICVDTYTSAVADGWHVRSIALTATGRGTDGAPVTFSRSGPEGVGGDLYVPLDGCVRVRGVITANDGRGHHATWTAHRVYGWPCKQAPNRPVS